MMAVKAAGNVWSLCLPCSPACTLPSRNHGGKEAWDAALMKGAVVRFAKPRRRFNSAASCIKALPWQAIQRKTAGILFPTILLPGSNTRPRPRLCTGVARERQRRRKNNTVVPTVFAVAGFRKKKRLTTHGWGGHSIESFKGLNTVLVITVTLALRLLEIAPSIRAR